MIRKRWASAEDISVIKRLFGEGVSQVDIARRFGIAQSHVSRLVRDRTRRSRSAAQGGQ